MSKYEFDGDKVKKLYGAMQKLGYQQSLGEFEKGFYGKDNYQKRKAVYDAMTEAGADLGSSYEDFMGRMRATSATKPTNKAPNTHISEQPWAQKSKEAKRAAAVLDGGFDALTRAVEVSSDEDFRNTFPNKLASERVEDPKSKRLITKPKKYRVPESDVREGGSMVRMVDAYKTVDGKAVSIPTTATSAQPSGNQDEDFATQYISGKINREEYKKKAKAKDNEAAIANSQPTMEGDEEFLYRTDKRYREYRDKILNGDGDVDELSPETKAWYLERVEARIKDAEERQKKYLSIINSDEHQKKLEENNTDFWRNFSQARGGVGAIGREQAKSMLRETDYTEDMDLANAGLGATESELTDLHALRDMLKGKDVGFFRRFKDFFGNRNNLTFGYQDFADNAALIANKNSKNPLVSSSAESKAKESEAATMYSRSANLRAKGGDVTGQMLPFVVEMASAGSMTSVAGNAAHKAVYSLGSRMLKSAALKGMEEGLLKATGTAALKVGTRGLSWIAHGLTAGALQTVTAGAGETAANITGRMVGHGAQQEDGSYAFEGGEDTVGAILHGFTSQLIENATEFMGGGLGYGVGKVASKLTKPLAKVGLGGVTNFFGRIAASPISKATSKTLSKFQIQGIPEEIGEEYLGWAGHSMAGDGDAEWSDFADFQKHKELWATMALSVGAMGAFAASGHVPSLLKRRGRSLKMADRAAAGAFSDEEKWNALRDKIDGTANNNVLRSLYDNVMQDKSLNGRERKAAMLYAGNLLAYRGANIGAIAGKRLALEQKRSDAEDARRAALVEGTASDDAERIDEHELDGDDVVSSAFRQGYEETSAANAYLWAKTLEEQEGHAMESLGLTEKELNEKFSPQNAGETLNEIRGAKEGTYTEEQKKAAFDYANTRAAYEGVVERTQDDIDSEIAYHHAIVDRQTNIDSGRLHPVKLFTSEKNKRDDAFLVSGRLAFEYNDKGESVVSTRLSDPTIVVSDAAGRTRMVSPSEIADAEDAIDVDEYKNTLAEHVRQEMEGRKYAEMLKAAEEAQANEVGEGEPEVPAVEGVSTSEEEHNALAPSESGGQSDVFGGSFNVGDKFSTEDGEFEVVQLTEGEAPIVQNVETGQQFRPHSEEDLRAVVRSYTPAFIDGAENAEGVTTYSRVAQEETAPQNEAQEGSQQEQEYALSDIISARGERFYADAEGNINLSQIPEKVLNVLELPNVPLRLTESMIEHIVVRHGKELSITSAEQAVRFVVDVMKRFDHVRKGNKKGTFVFSIENGRNKTGRRAVTLVVPEVQTEDTNPSPHVDNSSFLGVVTSGYESIEGLQKREILWEEGASVAPTAETASANVPTPSATQGGMTGGSASNQSISYREDTQSSAGVQEDTDISLENVQSALDKGEIEGVTPQMAHDALYGDPDLETEEVDAIVENSRSTSQANLAKLQKAEIKPRKNESVIAFKKRKAAHIDALAHAEELVRFWEEVQEHRRNLGAQAMQEEENAKQQREAEATERAKEQAENGLAVAPSWANAEKIVGRPGEFITPNGLRVKGHYVLVESGAAVPSHDARHGFKQSEGFPTDEKGHTLNDRDYERDLDAQRVQREIARNYDARATQQPVVVSPEGFVLSGNGRTMSGDLAAMENTDGAYNNYVREYPEMWGFTSDQVEKLEHPRVVFVSDNPLPLTTETFAAFNAQETKTQSRTEKAVKMGKAVSDEDFAKILRVVTDGHETLADFYGNMSGVSEVINLLETSGVITQQDRANLFDGDALSDEGRNLLENVLLGKAFESNPDVIRQLSEVRSLRTSVLNALFYIVENERLNEEFRLGDELSRAINFVYHARKGGGYSFGDKVRTFAQQTELFESTTDVSLEDATVLLLADALNDKRTTLIKSIFKSYNERAEDAGRGQMSLFGDALPSRETLIIETLALLGVDIKDYVPSNQVESSNQETNEQQEPKQQQQPEAGTSEPSIESTSEQGAEGKTETELSSGSVSTSGRGNEGVSTEAEGAKPSDKNAKPSENSTEKGKTNKGKKKQTSPSSKKTTRVLVSEEQHLKNQARLKELLRGTTLNVGINPEILALGIQEAAYYLEGGIRTFVDFASKMVEAFGDDVRPYVKAFYNGARDMPELAELGIDKEMTSYDEVREFDVGNFDKASETENENGNEAAAPIENDTPKEKGESPEQRVEQGDFAVGQTVYFRGTPWKVESVSPNGKLTITTEISGHVLRHENILPRWLRLEPIEKNAEAEESNNQQKAPEGKKSDDKEQEVQAPHLEIGQKVKYRTSSGNLRDAEVKALNRDGSVHLLVEVPNGAIPTMNVANASMSDIVIDEPTPQRKKEKQTPKTNKKNGQRNKSTHGSVGTETREDTRPAERGGVDRSDSGDNVPDGSGSTRISSVPRENGQRSTTDVKPESSDKETETNKKEDKNESKNLNSRSFHQTVAEAESLADENNTPAKRYRANIAAIKLIHQLEEEGRLENATPEEQKVLASYSSWGGLGVYFGSSAQSKVDELREVLTDEEFEDAVSSLSSGYFTPPHIVEGMWEVLRHLGFKGGRVFEGSAGVGGMLTLMPSDMLKNSSIRAVEKDSLTAKILKALHPDADVFSGGIEDVNAAPSSVDVAITNVPFVSGVRPVDKRNADITRLNLDLHDFAIAKNVRLLAPGGIGIFMTTSLTLDKGNKLKEWLNTNGEADVLGAFRFNNETFAGAPVTTDVIVIRKRDKGMVSPHAVRVLDNHVERVVSYKDEKTRERKPLQVSYNNYFHEHPEFMGGRMFAGAEKGDTFRPSSIGLYPDPSIDQKSQWEKWVGTFESMDKPLESIVPSEEEALEESSLPVGTLTVNSQGRLGVVDNFSKVRPIEDDGKKVKSKYTKAELLEDYNRVKEAVRAVLDYQLNNLEDDGLKPVLKELNKAYDDFVNKYGVFHNNQAIRILKNDADYQGIAALERVKEHRNEKTRKIEAQVSKSDFFTQRTLGGLEELKASTIEDGLRLSMSKENRIDSEFIAGLLNREVSDVEKELLDKELVYRNPTTGLLEDKASYLSGNVREKLSVAESQNTDGQYAKNINALTSVLPPTIPIHLISTPLGGTWFSPDYFRNFLAEKYGSRVIFYRAGSQWYMDGIVSHPHAMGGVRSGLLRKEGTSRTKYHWTVEELTLAAMNNVAPKAQATISKTDYNMPSGKTTIKISDEEASRAIIARMADLKDEFQSWMSKKMQEDPKAAAELEKSYNERFNSHVPYRADNSLVPEHFEGSNPAITLRSHQAAAAVRAVNSPTLLAHEVGTGKTFTMITAAAEMKRLGTANKPMIVVQNATLNQFASEAKKLYPAAKLLVYDANRDKGTDGRKAFYARIKYGDWDMIVVPQSVLDLIPDDPRQKEAYINEAVEEMQELAEQTEDRNVKRELEKQLDYLLKRQMASFLGSERNNSQRSLKDQEVAREKTEDKAERRMMRHTDEVAHFGEMGVDALIVDEAHEYKHLGFATMMARVKGVDPSASKKAVSLRLKTRHILENNGWKNVVFATGTPVSNTAAEVWTFMRYLIQPKILKQLQLYYFDDFVHNFGKIEQRLEFSTNGQFKEQTRFAGYQGLPELARIWASIADTVLAKDTDIKRPKRDNGQGEDADQDIFLEQTPSLVRIMKAVKAKLEEFEEMSGAEKKKNSHIPLTMFGLASAAAIDTRLVSSNAVDEPGSKTNAAVERTLQSLEDTKKERGTVAIFADKFRRFDTTEDGKRVVGFNLFEDIRKKLIARGVPAEQIVIMQEGMSDKAKADIFAKVNAGEIRVIMGSTQRLGVGVNIQERLNLLIHMDAPARPMDYTQRNGRILRQGNLYEEWGKPVHVVRFGVKDSLDVSAYQRLQTKEGFIRPIMESQRTMDNAMTQRSVEEDEGEFDNPVAQLSGSQYALLLQKAKREVRKYEAYEAQWKQDQTFIPQQLRKNAGLARNAQILLSSAEARLEMLRSIVPQGKVQDVALHLKDGGVAHNEDAIKLANSAINAIAKEIRAEQTSNERTLSLSFTLDNVKVEIRASLMGIQKFDEKTKTISTSVSTSLQWSSEDLGVKDEPLLVHRLGDALNYITESVISGAEAEEQIERAKGQLERLEKENASLHERQGVSFKYADELKRARGLATDFEQKMQEELKEQEARYAERMNKNGDFVVDDLEVDEMIMSQVAEQEAEEQEEGKAREQRTANENALDGVSPEQIELRDGLVDIMRDAGMDVSVSDAEGQRVLDLARGATIEADAVREAREIERANAVFNDELDAFSEDNANRIIFSLGRPSEVLRAAGVPDMPMKLYGSKLLKKIKKHGFDKVALRDLPRAVANPIAVFNNHEQEGNRAILTELHTEQGNVLVAIDLGKGADVDFNVVSSVFGKGKNGVVEWINKRQLTYVDEEKALNYLHLAAPIAAASDNQKLSLAANIINGFKNPKLSGENLRQQRKNSITEEMQSIKTKAQSDGTFMLAPNGEPTNLTERQWLQVRTESFKEWFGDWENEPEEASQMKDENGEPKVFYHNTNADFFAFNPLYNGSSTDAGWLGDGFYFYGDPSEGQGYGEKKMSVFLNIREPYYASEEENRSLSEQNDRSASLEFREERESEGYDGVYFNGDLRQETVVFSPSQIKSATDNVGAFDKENDDIRFYRGQHGEVRGFAVGGRIYLDPKMASDETAIHEYTHLWADALRRVNAAEWENVKGLLRDTPLWDETKRLYPELADDEDALADEVLAQFSGRHGAKRLAEAREKAMSEADGVFDKAKVASVFDNVRQALKRFWKGVADFLGLHFTSAEEVADKVLADLLNGVNPRNIGSSAYEAPTIREQRIDNDTREEMQRSVDELRVEVREGYEKAVKDWKYKMQEQWQDSMLALKTLQDELEKKGVKIEEWENAYWAENRMSSINEEEMKAYTRDYFKPIVAAQIVASKALPQELIDKLNAMDAHLREFEKMDAEAKQRNAVDNYLMLKHGLERNHVLAMRDAIDAQWKNPSEASSVWRAYNEDAGNRENRRLLQEGKRSFEEFLQVDDAIRAHYAGEEYLKNREKDYSGLTSMTTEELTELKDVENAALQLVKEAEDAAGAELSALWDKVKQATRASVEKLYKSGLLTPAAYSQMTTMFQWYVPLRGFAEETSDEVYDYVDQRNGNGMGAILRGADGRKSKADSPIAHIGSMAERSVVQGNRNLMKQHFYRMVMAHPNDLVSMGEIYLHHNEVTDEWEMMTPTHSPNATPEQIAEETRAFEERMQELVKQEPDNYLRLREHPDVPYRVLGDNLSEHQVLVKVLGRDKLLTVNGDPRVAQAVNGLFNPDAISNDFLKRLRNLNNFLAQMATQRNPEFIFRNLIRDRFYAMEAARVKDGAIDPQYVGRLQKNWISAVGQVVGLTARYNSGTLDMNDAQDRMFYEFMMNGGATGVTRLLNPEEYKGEIADIAKEMQRGEFHPAKVAKLVTKYVDLFGSCSEAITRFATYRTSRELGRSVARSVWDAKEITTNFNKKGAGSKAIRKDDGRWLRMSGETASFFKNFVIFTNANVQGFHNQWQLAKNNPKRFIARFVAKWVALGFAMPLINNLLAGLFGGDDDHYQDLPETARRNSLCLFVPKVGWVKIPLGFGLRSAYAVGGLLSERLFYPKGDYTSMMRSLFDIALDLMPLSMGSSEQDWWLNVVPSSLRPLAENIANKDWTGRPIVNENVNEHWPEYRRANNRTSNISIKISEALNNMTGGDEYTPGFVNLNPSQFEHIALGLLSGVGTLVGNTYETTANLAQGEELDTRHIPFLKDFFSTSGGATHTSAVKRDFYALKDEYEKTKVRVLGYEREEADGKNDPESVARRVDFTQNSADYKRYEVMDEAVSEVNSLRNDLKEATTPEEVKALEAEMQQVMEDAINDVRAIK